MSTGADTTHHEVSLSPSHDVEATKQKSRDPDSPKLTVEDKMDEDFMAVLSSIQKNLKNLSGGKNKELAQAWLQKLCGEAMETISAKRSRNIYLTRLACEMVEPKSYLNPPFAEAPPDGKLSSVETVFGLQKPKEKFPGIAEEMIDMDKMSDLNYTSHDGRTYFATRQMKNGMGAFGYLAVTVAEDEPLWVEAATNVGSSSFKTKRNKLALCKGPISQGSESRLDDTDLVLSMTQGGLKDVTSMRAIENIQQLLIGRRTPEERDELLNFYDMLLANILMEVENCGCGKAVHDVYVKQLLEKLEYDLKASGNDTCICEMSPKEKRGFLLESLYNKTKARKEEVEKREATLDMLEKTVHRMIEFEGRSESEEELPEDSLWSTAAHQGPSEQNMKRLLAVYPPELVERFVQLLGMWRQDMVRRSRNRHENVVEAMKKDLKAEVKLGRDKYKQARDSWMKLAQVLQEVQTAQAQAKEDEENSSVLGRLTSTKHEKDQAKLADQLVTEFKEAQKNFEIERQRGKNLKDQLNTECERIEESVQLSEALMEQLQTDGETLRTEMKQINVELEMQDERINELEALLQSIC